MCILQNRNSLFNIRSCALPTVHEKKNALRSSNVTLLIILGLHGVRQQVFLRNCLRRTISMIEHLLLQIQITDIENENSDLLIQIQQNQEMKNEKEDLYEIEDLDITESPSADSKTSQVEASTSVEMSVEESPLNQRKLITTTFEDEEKVVTEIKTEDVVENRELRKSRDIFQGFSSTLNRIEDLMSERKHKRPVDPILQRFGLSSYLRDDARPYSPALDYPKRSDDLYSSNYTTPSYKSYSGSHSKLNIDTNDSTYSSGGRPYGSPKYNSSKYDYNRSFGNDSEETNRLSRYGSMDNLSVDRKRDILLENYATSKRRSDNADKLVAMETDKRSLEDKCRTLESVIHELRQENSECLVLIEELAHLSPNNEKLRDVKRKLRSKMKKTDTSTQTNDQDLYSRNWKDYNALKVAHIKPLPLHEEEKEERRSYSPANTINVTYGLNENNIVRNIAQASMHQNVFNTSLSTYNTSEEKTNKSLELPLEQNKMPASFETNLLQFSPDNDKTYTQHTQAAVDEFSANVSTRFLDNDKSTRNSIGRSSRSRPQTWYGAPDDGKGYYKDLTYEGVKQTNNNGYVSKDRSLYFPEKRTDEEVIFSKPITSAWPIPSWMKSKRKNSSEKTQSVIQ